MFSFLMVDMPFLEQRVNKLLIGNEVKMRGPDQGLGPILASKKWGSGTDSRVQKSCCGTNPSYY